MKHLQDSEKMKLFFKQLELDKVTEANMKFSIYTDIGEELITDIINFTKEHQIELANLSLSMPSLNDVFLTLTGKELRDGGKEEEQ